MLFQEGGTLAEHGTQAPDEERLASLETEVAALREENKSLWSAITALGTRLAEATAVEEIIRRARRAPDIRD
jgi:hypothetical protein